MNPIFQPFNVLKAPFKANLRVWIKPEGGTQLYSYQPRRYKDGNLYWSRLHFAPMGRTLCLSCFKPYVSSISPDGRGWCLTCEARTDVLSIRV